LFYVDKEHNEKYFKQMNVDKQQKENLSLFVFIVVA